MNSNLTVTDPLAEQDVTVTVILAELYAMVFPDRPEWLRMETARWQSGEPDPIFVCTVSVSLTKKVNLGDFNSITPVYTDRHDVRHVSHSPANCIWRWTACGKVCGPTSETRFLAPRKRGSGGFFGLPAIAVEDLTRGGGSTNDLVVPEMQPASVPARPINDSRI